MQWHILIKEYGPTFHYTKGADNIIVDALSRLPTKEDDIWQPMLSEMKCINQIKDLWTASPGAMPSARNLRGADETNEKHAKIEKSC